MTSSRPIDAPSPSPWRRRALAGVGLIVGASVVLLVLGRFGDPPPLLPPYTPPEVPDVTVADFVGAETCAACHAETYERWAASTHGRAGGPAGPDRVLAPFDGTPIRFADATVTPRVSGDGRYVFVVEWSEGVDTLPVDGVVGGGHMEGGGTQGFFTRHVDGTQRFLPFDWSRTAGAWFCNARAPEPGRWLRITPALRLTQCADWPPRRMLGQVRGMTNCDTCHGSQIQAAFDPDARAFRTSFTSLAVNCESCHGPGRRHVDLMESGGALTEADLGLPSLGILDEDGSLETCFRCHATRLVLHEGDLPGQPLEANASLLLPLLTDRPFLPDNRVATFGYQLNHRGSGCYLDGSMTCVSCHDPHGQTYQDEQGSPLPGRFDDGQCLGCHGSKAADPTAHTFHAVGSPGSRCVACHMPYLQHPVLGDDVPYARSDHTIPVPRPGLDEQLGITSACAGCHSDRPVQSLAAQADAWYGRMKPWRPMVQGLARSGAARTPAEAAELLLRPDDRFAMAQASGLSQFLLRFVQPDTPLSPPVRERLDGLARHPDPDVRALALASIHLAAGDDPDTRAFLSDRVAEWDGERARIRDRWAAALRYVGDVLRLRGDPGGASVAYMRALEAVPGDAYALEGLGLARLQSGDAASAASVLAAAVEADPTRVEPLLARSRALAALDRPDEEMALLRGSVERFPRDPRAHFEMGNALLGRRDFPAAARAFEDALALDPGLASPRLGLAQVLAARGDTEEARRQAALALAFEPANPQARQLLERLSTP